MPALDAGPSLPFGGASATSCIFRTAAHSRCPEPQRAMQQQSLYGDVPGLASSLLTAARCPGIPPALTVELERLGSAPWACEKTIEWLEEVGAAHSQLEQFCDDAPQQGSSDQVRSLCEQIGQQEDRLWLRYQDDEPAQQSSLAAGLATPVSQQAQLLETGAGGHEPAHLHRPIAKLERHDAAAALCGLAHLLSDNAKRPKPLHLVYAKVSGSSSMLFLCGSVICDQLGGVLLRFRWDVRDVGAFVGAQPDGKVAVLSSHERLQLLYLVVPVNALRCCTHSACPSWTTCVLACHCCLLTRGGCVICSCWCGCWPLATRCRFVQWPTTWRWTAATYLTGGLLLVVVFACSLCTRLS